MRSDSRGVIRRFGPAVASLFLGAAVSGCSTYSFVAQLWNVSIQTESVTLSAAPNVNRDFPVAVDMVAVQEKAFAQALADTTASTWFNQKATFLANNPKTINVRSFEVVPGQTIDGIDYSWGDRRSYTAIFVFADYLAPGPHRIRVGKFDNPTVVLGPETLEVSKAD